jgi:hypothetical protein
MTENVLILLLHAHIQIQINLLTHSLPRREIIATVLITIVNY